MCFWFLVPCPYLYNCKSTNRSCTEKENAWLPKASPRLGFRSSAQPVHCISCASTHDWGAEGEQDQGTSLFLQQYKQCFGCCSSTFWPQLYKLSSLISALGLRPVAVLVWLGDSQPCWMALLQEEVGLSSQGQGRGDRGCWYNWGLWNCCPNLLCKTSQAEWIPWSD